jgi:hypothetical protein
LLKGFDARMGAAGRKDLLFVGKCATHPPNRSFLRSVKIVFVPADCTSMLNPLDLGIIHCMKTRYRKALVQKTVTAVERKAKLKLMFRRLCILFLQLEIR